MSFRSRANPDQRRRRVLLEESTAEEPTAALPKTPRRKTRYADDALSDSQPRVTDLLPGTWQKVAIVGTLLLAADLLVIALAWWHAWLSERFPAAPLELLRASDLEGLARLWITAQCMLATIVSALIFAIRRRKLDDLKGTYQIWAWLTLLAACLVPIASTSLASLLTFAIQQIPAVEGIAMDRGYLWILMAATLVPAAARMLVEMRRVRTAQCWLVIAGVALIAGECVGLTVMDRQIAEVLFAALQVAAATLLCISLLWYGCYVKLDAQGAFRIKKKKPKKALPDEDLAGESDPPVSTPARIEPLASGVARPQPHSIGAAINAARAGKPDVQGAAPLSRDNRKPIRR